MAITDRDKERLNLTSPAANDIGLGDIIQELQGAGGGGGGPTTVAWADVTGKPTTFTPSSHTHTASQISDASAVGKGVLTAADAAAARTAIGAGTSNLKVGTTANDAKAGNWTPAAATTSAAGIVKQAAAQANSAATDVAGLVADFNALLDKLRSAGIISA